jgi:hypothetical protein
MGLPFITKSSPNSGGMASSAGLPLDLITWWLDPMMRSILAVWLDITESRTLRHETLALMNGFDRLTERWVKASRVRKQDPIQFLTIRSSDWKRLLWVEAVWGKPLNFGRLGFKEEPGKIRVFAMVNLITQALMAPLHEWLFERLRRIPTDGTFDQTGPVDQLVKRLGGKGWIASYDLSAATDRLPVSLQVALLEPLLGRTMANLWAYVLVSRPYALPKIAKSYNLGYTKVWYKVGQPMGALSSWAMLAMTHHAIVQLAASRANPGRSGWFMDYALLGDDIVIANKAVAKEYLEIMDCIGVEVGLAKSLISPTCSLEFAKRTWIKGRQATPYSLAEITIATGSVAALEELWRKAKLYGEIRIAAVARFLGFGYKNLARLPVGFSLNNRLSRLLGYLSRPGGLFPVSLESWILSDGPGFKVALDYRTGKKIAGILVQDIVDLVANHLNRVERTIDRSFNCELDSATRKVRRTASERKQKDPRRLWKHSNVYGPTFKECIFAEYNALWRTFFKDWVLYPYLSKVSRKYSELRVRLRGLGPFSIHGFSGLEQAWRWIESVSGDLKSLPTDIALFDRQDDVRVAPSAKIRLWMKLRRAARKSQNPNIPPKPVILMKNEYGAWQRQL